MIQAKKTITDNHSVVVIFNNSTTDAALKAAVPAQILACVSAYKKAKKVKENSCVIVPLKPDPKAPSLAMINLGDTKDVSVSRFRSLTASAVRSLKDHTCVQWVVVESVDDWEHHLGQVIAMANYSVPNQKSNKSKDAKKDNATKHWVVSSANTALQSGLVVGQAVNKARDFANQPANVLTTKAFVTQIKALFKGDKRYKVTVLEESDLKKKKMHALLGVGQGSQYPSYLVDITYSGAPAASKGLKAPVGLVGKGVVCDTGGISIKPSRNMKEMKGDMGGAAAVVGAAWAAGALNLKRQVSFVVPIVENMVSKEAQRPGDVVVASNGTSIEITNTDAEGRLILADALVYTAKKKVACMLDIATLTGASIIALGPYAISVMGNNQQVVDQLLDHAKGYNEQCWQLPLFDAYKDLLKSDVADILNANEGREAGTITAAKFLEQFVGDTPWAHLDIASTMSVGSTKGDMVKGMTGAGTRALIAFMTQYSA